MSRFDIITSAIFVWWGNQEILSVEIGTITRTAMITSNNNENGVITIIIIIIKVALINEVET